jgi:hypothetical protein
MARGLEFTSFTFAGVTYNESSGIPRRLNESGTGNMIEDPMQGTGVPWLAYAGKRKRMTVVFYDLENGPTEGAKGAASAVVKGRDGDIALSLGDNWFCVNRRRTQDHKGIGTVEYDFEQSAS